MLPDRLALGNIGGGGLEEKERLLWDGVFQLCCMCPGTFPLASHLCLVNGLMEENFNF